MSKVIVITGAGVGLGRALARRFASEGDSVVLLGRTPSKVEVAAAEIGAQATAIGCDVSSPDSVREAFAQIAKKHPRIDVLINNAAVFEPFLIAEATDDQIVNTVNTNLTGAMLCVRSAIPLMGAGSHIINVSSESVGMRFPHLVAYQTSKAGLERFSEGLHHELEPNGIRVTSVRAGQMFEEGKTWDVSPEARMCFGKAAIEAGVNLRERPISQFTSVTNAFRALIDMPPDLHTIHMSLSARKSS
ncbi:SDR family oxidoreductase [Stenotrophobium rhamnosiphilum]|uniref:NAD(P)-dependent oxidoreductase n=1 Tax=Stenotrophobium rhamnosiphilum TaxID=2029166 RepID=A0A2T5MCY6_9GAMM|nr:SDR family oxidoreductase [Stenotrophobium rhamnosiphilum]PTU30442.1 NAD(P)-dependent oxidoreductase [Stenotrophobium rhamnosiphilum]